jgi:transcriptional regulator with XRE-family HTH domain
MEAIKEREHFSQRLKEALNRAGETSDSPSSLARGFNRRYPGKPVSSYAARKWLLGEAIPGQDKLRVLAQWLGVRIDWLRFGEGDLPEPGDFHEKPGLNYELLRAIASLSEEHQFIVQELVKVLQGVEGLALDVKSLVKTEE